MYDAELGLVYYNYRYYSPRDGRWTRRDPVDNAMNSRNNYYSFVRNSSGIDVLGLADIRIYIVRVYDKWETLSDWTAEPTAALNCGTVTGKGIELKKGQYALKRRGEVKKYPIPEGTYKGQLVEAPDTSLHKVCGREKKYHQSPSVENVKNFSGIRWHAGTSVKSTEGCMVVGGTYSKEEISKEKSPYTDDTAPNRKYTTFELGDSCNKMVELMEMILCVKCKIKKDPTISYEYTSK